ncbi:MAG: hypothetical protein GY829_07115, partial [Gammaproteobacteria bacterium]|nr:hypothetical protein [Gammaproteobacteria bacterium]
WRLSGNKQLRELMDGLGETGAEAKTFIDGVFDDLDPQKTTQLDLWDSQFGLRDVGLSTQARRDRLAGAWQLTGGQAPRYIQDTLQGSGFDVYVHEWWEPGSEPAVGVKSCTVARNPLVYLQRSGTSATYVVECGEDVAQCGEDVAELGNSDTPTGYALVNKVVRTERGVLAQCGEDVAQCGEALASCGNFVTFVDFSLDYVVPFDTEKWPYILYIGGATFGDSATVDSKRRDEFEALCLKICPSQQWLGIMINYS